MMITDGLLIAATAISPVLAVQVQKFIEKLNVRKSGQMRVFKALMATRATRVAADHVQALNMIDLEFSGKTPKEKEVVKRWRIYADHLNEKADEDDKASIRIWVDKGDELFADLLEALARCLRYDFSRVELKRGIYYPRAHDEQERRRIMFENAICKVMTGEAPLAMRVVDFPMNAEAVDAQMQVWAAMMRVIGGGRLQVVVDSEPQPRIVAAE